MADAPKTRPRTHQAEPPFGEWVAYLRKQLGFTQVQLAEKAGISQALVSRIERAATPGEAAPEATLRKLSRAMNCSYTVLLGGKDVRMAEDFLARHARKAAAASVDTIEEAEAAANAAATAALVTGFDLPPPPPTSTNGHVAAVYLGGEQAVDLLASAIGRAFDPQKHDIRATSILLRLLTTDSNLELESGETADLTAACGLMLTATEALRTSGTHITGINLLLQAAIEATRGTGVG